MLPNRVSNPGPLTYESGALPIALRGPVEWLEPLGYGAKSRRKVLKSNPGFAIRRMENSTQQYMGTLFESGRDNSAN